MTTQAALTQFPNWHIFGHDWAIDYLSKSLKHGRNRHAYLITGASNIGKDTLAHTFAQALNCTHEDEDSRPCGQCRSCKWVFSGNHPDIIHADNDPKTGIIKINAVRDVCNLLALKPYASRYRVALFSDFDRARGQTQDALLKTLEEPSSHAVLILLAQSIDHVLPTITSRCQIITLRPTALETVSQVLEAYGASQERAHFIGRLSGGRIGWALSALEDEGVLNTRDHLLDLLHDALIGHRRQRFGIAEEMSKWDKNDLRYTLEIWQTYWRDLLLLAENSPIKPCNTDKSADMQHLLRTMRSDDILYALQVTRKLLHQTLATNANVRLALEAMMLDYPNLKIR